MRALLRLAVASALLPLASAACTDATDTNGDIVNAGPTINAVEGADTFSEQGGVYVVEQTLRYTDPEGDAVARGRVRIPDLGVDVSREVQQASAETQAALLSLTLPGNVPKRTYDVTYNLIDVRGAEGPPATKAITLQ